MLTEARKASGIDFFLPSQHPGKLLDPLGASFHLLGGLYPEENGVSVLARRPKQPHLHKSGVNRCSYSLNIHSIFATYLIA